MQKPSVTKSNKSAIISIRINGASTSVSLRKNIIALWVLLENINLETWKDELNNFVQDCSMLWSGETAKGLSEFILNKMIESFIEDEDINRYNKIHSFLNRP